MPDCLFCKISKEEIPSDKIYEDEYTYAFLDIKPGNLGHTLVIPKNHFENIYSLVGEDLCRWILSVQKLAVAIKNGLGADGINLLMNNEIGQEVPHAHMHIVPRFHDDGFHFGQHKEYKEGEAKEIAEKIKKELL